MCNSLWQSGNGPGQRIYTAQDKAVIKAASEIKDHSILMTDTDKFEYHIEAAVREACKMLGWVLRSFITRYPQPLMTLYRALVLPHLEYCCQLWNPISVGSIRRLKSVQSTFSVRLTGMGDSNYWQILVLLKLYSLERRRERYIIVYTLKILEGLTPNIFGERGPEIQTVEGGRRGWGMCAIPQIYNRVRVAVPSVLEGLLPMNGARLFNVLPRNIREYSGLLTVFKNKLDLYLQTVPDTPHHPHYYLSTPSNSLLAHQ